MADILGYTSKTIAPAGRNKYGRYFAAGNITKSVISTTYGGNNTTTTIGDTGSTGTGVDNVSFYCMLLKPTLTFEAESLAGGVMDSSSVVAYRGYTKAPTLICDMSRVSATTNEEGIVEGVEGPADSGVTNVPCGMTFSITDNGTSAATFILNATATVTGNTGTIGIPVLIYKREDAVPVGDDLYDWWDSQADCEQVWLDLTWVINRAATGNYTMDLSNQTAGVNCDSAGTLYPNSIATLQCTAVTYFNGAIDSAVTYSLSIQPQYLATGVSINSETGALTFNSGGTKFFWATAYPALPIDIIASKEGQPIASKTMTVERNYPGTDGTPAHTRWINTDANIIVYNSNTSAYTPTAVTGQVWLQVGDELPVQDSATTIYQWYDGLEQYKVSALGSITAATQQAASSVTFALKNASNQYYEVEDVPIVPSGANGKEGPSGATGPSGDSAWYLSLTNDNASINCDSAGTILPNAVRPTCQAKLYYGKTRDTGASYLVDYGGASGVTSGVSNGILTLTFGSAFNFTGTSVAISVSGFGGNPLSYRDTKIMNVSKSIAGENGEDAISYWLEVSYGEIIYNPNNNTFSPNKITASGFTQVGQGAVSVANNATYKYQYYSRSAGEFGYEYDYPSTGISITSAICESYSRLRITMYVGNSQVDQEDVDILRDGVDASSSGQGRQGPAIRGPYNWYDISGSTRCWCAGSSSSTCSDCDKWIDVIIKDDVYYYRNTSYYGKVAPWNSYSSYWTSGDSFDFVATNLLLAENAKIKFLSGNEIYIMSGNNINAGIAGGTGINFWAGAPYPEDAPYKVYNDGTIAATKGVFAGYIQYPYTFVNELNTGTIRFKVYGSGNYTSATGYVGDNRAYLVSDWHNTKSSRSVGGLTGITASYFFLPFPTSEWNGFTYDIIVEPNPDVKNAYYADEIAYLDVVVSGATGTTSAIYDRGEIYCYAFSEPKSSREFLLQAGRYQITCMPKRNSDSLTKEYNWSIIYATGSILRAEYEAKNTENITTLLATAHGGIDPLYKLTTYSGTTAPDVHNKDLTMFIKK